MRKISVYLSCLMCGLETDTVRLQFVKLRPAIVQQAFQSAAEPRPHWEARHAPRCPRCGGRLLLGQSEGAARDYVEPVLT